MPRDPEDDRAIKEAVRFRERRLRKTSKLPQGFLDTFANANLLACRDYVVMGVERCDVPVDTGQLRAVDNSVRLFGPVSEVYQRVVNIGEDAARQATAANITAATQLGLANRSVDNMLPESSASVTGTLETLRGSFMAGLDADHLNQVAYRLGGVGFAARLLMWGSKTSSNSSPYVAAKSAICAIAAVRWVTSSEAFAPTGTRIQQQHEHYRTLSDQAVRVELQRQVDFLRAASASA